MFQIHGEERKKEGILNLVRNNIYAHVRKSYMGVATLIQLAVHIMEMKLMNYFYPNYRPLSLSSVSFCTHFMAVGDFGSYSQRWALISLTKGVE